MARSELQAARRRKTAMSGILYEMFGSGDKGRNQKLTQETQKTGPMPRNKRVTKYILHIPGK